MKKKLSSALLFSVMVLTGTSGFAIDKVDGVYQIGNASEFKEFADLVNGGDKTAKAELNDDIDLTEYPNIIIKEFTGVFDGQNHRITGFSMTTTGGNQGLFGYCKSNAVIKNFRIEGKLTACVNGAGLIGRADNTLVQNVHSALNIDTNVSWVAGIAGAAEYATFENCSYSGTFTYNDTDGGSHGGIVGTGYYDCVIRNCANYGTFSISGTAGTGGRTGGIIGYCNRTGFKMENCLNVGSVQTGTNGWAHALAGNLGGSVQSNSFVNNYWLEGTGDKVSDRDSDPATMVTLAQLASGEVAQKLGVAWYQNIDVEGKPADAMPTLIAEGHARVYAVGTVQCDGVTPMGNVTYSNINTNATIVAPHDFDGFTCLACGSYNTVDGYFMLANASDFEWFVQHVNNGNIIAKAKMVSDIDLDSKPNLVINSFSGEFDGQNHSITNYSFDSPSGKKGLFSSCKNNAIIKNFSISGTFISKDWDQGLIGKAESGTLIQNVHSALNITAIGSDAGRVAGIAGGAVNTTIEGCSYSGTFTYPYNSGNAFGGIVGCSWEGTIIRNCLFSGSMGYEGESGNGGLSAGILGYCNRDTFGGLTNCLSVGTIKTGTGNTAFPIAGSMGAPKESQFENNYWLDTTASKGGNKYENKMTAVSAEQLASGEVAYNLGAAWRQTIGTDNVPTLSAESEKVLYIGAAGYATFYDEAAAWKLLGNAKAYIGKVQGEYLTLTEIADIPAETAVVLAGTYYNKVATTATASTTGNDLLGTNTDMAANGVYVLALKDEVVGFYKATTGTIAAGKAYLPAGSEAKAFFFAEDATAIAEIEDGKWNIEDSAIYNLAGQRISRMQKGINIVGGKKVMK